MDKRRYLQHPLSPTQVRSLISFCRWRFQIQRRLSVQLIGFSRFIYCFNYLPDQKMIRRFKNKSIQTHQLLLSTEIFSKRRKIYPGFEEKPEYVHDCDKRHVLSDFKERTYFAPTRAKLDLNKKAKTHLQSIHPRALERTTFHR